MTTDRRIVIWAVVIAATLLMMYVLRGVLTPFLAGMAIAYLLDPLADRLERAGVERGWAAAIILGAFLILAIVLLLLLAPVLYQQAIGLAARLPDYVDQLVTLAKSTILELQATLSPTQLERLKDAAGAQAGDLFRTCKHLIFPAIN